jgi:hypothetical protein
MGIRISEMEEATTFGADDYVPIVKNGTNKKALGQKIKDFIAGFFVSKSGDSMTGDLNIAKSNPVLIEKNTDYSLTTSADNDITTTKDIMVRFDGSDGAFISRLMTRATTNGYIETYLQTRNRKTDGTYASNSITAGVRKDGTSFYSVTDQEAFRKAIGLDYSVTTQTYDGLTWTIVKMGNLYDLYTEITIPANTTPATWGSLYVYRNSNKQWWNLPVTLTKKMADLSFTDGSTAGIPIAYTDISSKPNSATTADIARPTTTSSAIIVRKFICGYVS